MSAHELAGLHSAPLTLSVNANLEPCGHGGTVGVKRLIAKAFMTAGACAAVAVLAAPAPAAAQPAPVAAATNGSVEQAVEAFYASRGGAPFWLRAGANSSAANELMAVLQRAPLDGLASGPALALQAQALIGRASAGDTAALGQADRLLSTAWIMYVEALQRPPAGMSYADSWVKRRRDTPLHILLRAAAANSLTSYVRKL